MLSPEDTELVDDLSAGYAAAPLCIHALQDANPATGYQRIYPVNMYSHRIFFNVLHAYLRTCVPAYLRTCVPAYLRTCVPAYLRKK